MDYLEIGYAYYNGTGCEVNYQEAYNYFCYAYNEGNIEAAYMIGKMCLEGQGLVQSTDVAYQYIKYAAENNCKYAQNALADMIHNGLIPDETFEHELKWRYVAAMNGEENALNFFIDFGNRCQKEKEKANKAKTRSSRSLDEAAQDSQFGFLAGVSDELFEHLNNAENTINLNLDDAGNEIAKAIDEMVSTILRDSVLDRGVYHYDAEKCDDRTLQKYDGKHILSESSVSLATKVKIAAVSGRMPYDLTYCGEHYVTNIQGSVGNFERKKLRDENKYLQEFCSVVTRDRKSKDQSYPKFCYDNVVLAMKIMHKMTAQYVGATGVAKFSEKKLP